MLVVLFHPVVGILPLAKKKGGVTPTQYPQFCERVVAMIQEGPDVRNFASWLGIAAATIYRW